MTLLRPNSSSFSAAVGSCRGILREARSRRVANTPRCRGLNSRAAVLPAADAVTGRGRHSSGQGPRGPVRWSLTRHLAGAADGGRALGRLHWPTRGPPCKAGRRARPSDGQGRDGVGGAPASRGPAAGRGSRAGSGTARHGGREGTPARPPLHPLGSPVPAFGRHSRDGDAFCLLCAVRAPAGDAGLLALQTALQPRTRSSLCRPGTPSAASGHCESGPGARPRLVT